MGACINSANAQRPTWTSLEGQNSLQKSFSKELGLPERRNYNEDVRIRSIIAITKKVSKPHQSLMNQTPKQQSINISSPRWLRIYFTTKDITFHLLCSCQQTFESALCTEKDRLPHFWHEPCDSNVNNENSNRKARRFFSNTNQVILLPPPLWPGIGKTMDFDATKQELIKIGVLTNDGNYTFDINDVTSFDAIVNQLSKQQNAADNRNHNHNHNHGDNTRSILGKRKRNQNDDDDEIWDDEIGFSENPNKKLRALSPRELYIERCLLSIADESPNFNFVVWAGGLGSGDSGDVSRVFITTKNPFGINAEFYAIKCMKLSPKNKTKMEHETIVLSSIKSEYVMKILGLGSYTLPNCMHFFIMHLGDANCRQVRQDIDGNLPAIHGISKQMLHNGVSGLSAIHALGIIHSDMKLSNMVMHDYKWKIIDFNGCVSFNGEIRTWTTKNAAPEYLAFHHINQKCLYNAHPSYDIWSFGVAVFEWIDNQSSITVSSDSLFKFKCADVMQQQTELECNLSGPKLSDNFEDDMWEVLQQMLSLNPMNRATTTYIQTHSMFDSIGTINKSLEIYYGNPLIDELPDPRKITYKNGVITNPFLD